MAGVLDKYRKNTEGQNAAATSGGVYGTREVGGVLDKYKTPAKKEEEVTLTDPYGMWKLEQQMREQMQKAKAEREAKEAAAQAATQNTVLAAQRAVEGAKQAQEAAAQRQREAKEAEARKEWMGAQGEIFRAMQSGEYDTLEALAQDSAEKKAVYDEAKAVRHDAVNQKYAPERFDPFVQAAGATPLDKYDVALLEKGKTAQGNPLYQNPQQWLQGGGMAGANAAMERQQALAALTEEQKAYINYLYGTYDKKLAAELTETLLQNVRNAATLDKENAPAGQKVQNVLSAVGGGIFAAPQYVAEMAKNTAENIAHGTNLSVADYTPGARAMSEQAARTQAVVDSAETPVGKFLTETGLSVGQNAVNTLLFGRLAPAVMAVESAAQGGYGAAQNGATGGQQVAKAVQSAVTEYLTEKISWGKLDKLLNGMGAKTAKEAIAKIAAQMATEGGEELVSEAVGMLYDWIAMGDAGDLKQTMNAYRAENGTEGQAEHLALEILRRLGSAALAGGISGGVLGGGAQLLNAAQTPAVGAGRTARNAADLQPAITDDGQAGGETVQELVEMAKKSRDPQVQQLAQMVESGNARPAVVSALAEMLREDAEMNAQAGDLTQETAQQIPQAERLAQEKAEESEFGAAQSAMPQTEAGREAQQMEGMREYADEGGVFAADAEELAAGNAQGTVADFAQTAADQMPARPANKRSAERRARDAARELLAGKEGEERILQAFRQMDAATMTPEMRQVVAQNIAKELVKEGPYIRKDFWESFAPLREYLKKTQMNIDPQTLGEIKNMGFSVTKFNEKYGTKLTTKNGPGMRSLDGTLAEWAPLTNGIVKADAANAFDALVHTLEVMRQGKAGELDKQGLESAIDGTAEVLLKYADETMEPDELAALEKKGGEKPVLQSTAKEKPQGTGWERFGENRIAQAMQHKPEGTVANIGDAERVRHAEEEIAKARKLLQGLKDNAEKGEVSTAESIARGEMTLQDVSPRFSVEKVALMAEQLRLIRQWEEQGQSGQRRMLHTQEFEQAERMLEDADDAIFGVSQKESENTRRKRLVEAGKLLASTSERVMYKVFEPATAKRMIERYIRPAERNEAAKIMAISRLFDGARELGLNDYESTMTQLVGEGLIEAWSKAGENPQWTDGQKMIESLPEYARANPEIRRLAQHMDKVDADKVTKAVEWYRKTYADFHALVNDFRLSHGMAEIGTIENYFPHFSDSMDGDMLNRTLKAFGIEQMTNLPASISGRTAIFRPNSRWVGNFQRRTGPQTVFDANMGFQVYANAVMDMLYHTDDIMRIRHLETMVRERSDAQQQSGEREGTEERRERMRERMREKLNDPEQMKRLEEQMEADVKGKDLAEEYSGFVIWLREYANKLANKGEGYGRMSETVAGRATANTLNKLLSNYSTAQIVGNVRSALANTAVLPKMIALLGTQSGASMFNAEVYVGQALRKMANGEMADVYGKSEFMTSKQGVDPLSRTRKEKSADRLMWFFNVVEDAMSKLAFTAKYVQAHDAMKQSGKSAQEIEREAIQQANDFAAQVMSRRDKAGASLLSSSRDPLIKLANMFQNEISNEYQTFVQDLPREAQQMAKELGKGKTAAVYGAALARYVLYSNVLAFFAESIFGINPFNDPLGWLTDLIENIWEEPEEEDEKGKVNWNAAGEFIGDVAGAIPYVSILAAAAGYTNDRLPLFNAKEFGEDLLSIATAERLSGKLEGVANVAGSAGQLLGVPFAGQAVKTIKGAIAVADAGKRSQKTGQLQDAWTWDGGEGLIDAARAVTFGPSAMKGVREYYETGKAELTSAQTEAYDAAIGADIPRDEALAYVKWSKDVTSDKDKDGKTVPNSKRVKYLERANDMPGLTGEQKAILYQGELNSEQAEEFARATEEIQELGFDMDTWLDFLEGYYRINGTGKKDRVKKLLATLGVTGAQARLMAKAAGYDIS